MKIMLIKMSLPNIYLRALEHVILGHRIWLHIEFQDMDRVVINEINAELTIYNRSEIERRIAEWHGHGHEIYVAARFI